jgi:hypothetical protein
MNNISWFIYFAEVIPNLKIVGVVFGLISFVSFFILPPKGVKMFSLAHEGPFMGYDRPLHWVFLFLSILFLVFTPSKETIYLVAGSEIAEYTVNTEYGQEILNDIKEVIQLQIKDLRGD